MLETGGVVVEVLNARESVHERGHGRKEGMRDREGGRSGEAECCPSREEVAKDTVRPVVLLPYRIGRDDGICTIFWEPSDRYEWSASLVRRERKE